MSRLAQPITLFCRTPAYPSCSSLWAWRARASIRSRGLLIGPESCSLRAASTKVFQRSQPVGVGVCFESLPTDPVLSNAVRRLCRELGYFGIFEVEFLWFDGRWAAIDFNPRLFNQIGMDIRRGMPLPLLACLDAAGETAALRDAVAKAQAEDEAATNGLLRPLHPARDTFRSDHDLTDIA